MKARPLFVFEMANNHQGSVAHGKRIMEEIRRVCDDFPEFEYGFKFQYRDLDTFIHPDYKKRMDVKNVKRFQETRLTMEQFSELLAAGRAFGFIMICTPFDEVSVDNICTHGYDYIKIASCSLGDWPLLEKIATAGKPVIASTAGGDMETIQNVVRFFENRNIELSLMHCVAEYPTPLASLEMNQLTFLMEQFPGHCVGFSTHEPPQELLPVSLAVAKGARIFEKHVGVPTETITLNGYSASPSQVREWLTAAKAAFDCCGVLGKRYASSAKEQADLAALQRGVFAKKSLRTGQRLSMDDVYLAFPCQPGQLTAQSLSKYNEIHLQKDVAKDGCIQKEYTRITNTSRNVEKIVKDVIGILQEGNVVVPEGSVLEISHHYGIERFYETGAVLIDCINREYCKKLMILLPGQKHPNHYHEKKEETFVVLHGTLSLVLDGTETLLGKGDVVTVERGAKHSFSSKDGCVFEEISTTHFKADSFYEDAEGFAVPRKTKVHLTQEMLQRINQGQGKREA